MGLLTALHPSLLVLFLLPTVAAYILYKRYTRLSHIPGPFLANFTDAWRAYQAWKIDQATGEPCFQSTVLDKYGDVVRMGPNAVLVNDPEALPTVMGIRERLRKGPGYNPIVPAGGASALTAILDEETHSKYRRPVAASFSLSTVKGYEGYIDETIQKLIGILNERVKSGEPVNMSAYTHYWAFDTISKVSYGEHLGFLEHGSDFNGMIAVQKEGFRYFGVVGQWPILDNLLKRNPVLKYLGFYKPTAIVNASYQIVSERLKNIEKDPEAQKKTSAHADILASFMASQPKFPVEMSNERIAALTMGNLFAGGNSTALAMDGAIKYFAENPSAWERLYREVTDANLDSITDENEEGPVHLDHAFKLPYMVAVTTESLRMSSVEASNLERIASEAGMTLPNGMALPPGTIAAINPCAMLRRKATFGADAHEFKPERWLQREGESEAEFADRKYEMEKAMVQFGSGSRSCLGKNIARLELYKIWPNLVREFTFEAVGQPKLRQVWVKVHKRS